MTFANIITDGTLAPSFAGSSARMVYGYMGIIQTYYFSLSTPMNMSILVNMYS